MKVCVIIPTYWDAFDRALQNCLTSLIRSKGIEIEIIVMSACLKKPIVPDGIKVVEVPRDIMPDTLYNAGAELASKDTTHFVFANDDVIVSQYAIAMMASFCNENPIMLNPISNCENGGSFFADFQLRNEAGQLMENKRQYKLEEVFGFEESIMNYPAGYNAAFLSSFLCMYFTMISVKNYQLVGPPDGHYKLGITDLDYSLMVKEKGLMCMTHLGAFVFHHSGLTTNETHASRDQSGNISYFNEKWKWKFGEDAYYKATR